MLRSKDRQEWWVHVKGEKPRGAFTHRVARASALVIASMGGSAPTLHRVVDGETVAKFKPIFPDIQRQRA